MADISQYLKKARQMDEEKGVAYKATPSTSTNSGAYTPSKSGVDISSYLKKAREMDANNATVSMPNANSQQKDDRKQQQYLSYLAGLDLDAQKKKAEDLDKQAAASRAVNYFADTPQYSNASYFDVAPESFQPAQKTKEEAEADLAWKDYNLAKSLQYSIAGEQALDSLNDDVYAEVDKLAQAWLSPDIYNTIAEGSTERLRNAGYTDAEIEQLVDYRKRQINRSEYDEKVAKTEELANNGFWGAAGASVAAVPQRVASGAGYIDLALQKAQNLWSGNDRPLDYYTQAMSLYGQSDAAISTVTQNIEDNAKTELGGKIGSFLYNTGMSMADFIAVAPLGGAGMALLGSSAATATAVDIRDRGGDDTQALLGGALAGAAEAVFENESLKSLFALSKPVAKETLRSGFKRVLKNVAKQGWEEGKEELFTSLANAMTDRMVMGELSSYNTAVRDYMANGLSAEEAERKATMDFIVQCATDTLAGFVSGGALGGVTTAARGYAASKLYGDKADALIDEALKSNPEDAFAKELKGRTDAGKRVGGNDLADLVEQNSDVQKLARTIAWEKSPEYQAAEEKAMGGLTASKSGKTTLKSTGKETGKLEIIADKDGGLKLKTESGEIVDAKAVDFASKDEAIVYSAVLNMGASAATAQSIADNFDGTNGMAYAADVKVAYQYGKMNFPESYLSKLSIKEDQAKHAYSMGRSDAMAVKSAERKTTKYKQGSITYEFDVKNTKLSDLQKASIAGIEALANLSSVNFHLFESDRNNGYSYTMPNGKVVSANGWYVSGTNEIWVDINAGNNGAGLMIHTAAHEVSHYIRKWSDAKWREIADFLIEQYGEKGADLNAMLQEKMTKVRKFKPELSEAALIDEAYEEFIADALSEMLVDGRVVEKMAELKKKDRTLWEKIKEAIKDLLERWGVIRKEYEGINPDAKEAWVLRDMEDTFKKLQDMYAEAFADADANFSAAEELSTDAVPVEESVKHSFRSLAEAAGFGALEQEDGTKIFVRDNQRVNKVTMEDIENSPIGAMINFSLEMKDITEEDAKRQKEMFVNICNMAIKTGDFNMTMQFAGSAVFTGMKANADKQYGTTYDFPSICTKTQAVIDAMSARMVKLGRGLRENEIVEIYREVFASGNPVPCPECYVFSRWIGIGGLLDNIKTYQDTYGNMSVEEAAAAYDKLHAQIEKIAEEKELSFGKAKGKLASDLQREYNKLTERIEKNRNQGEKVNPADEKRLADIDPMMTTVKALTWLENVYFADEAHTKVNPNFRVPNEVLFDLNNGEEFASKYKAAWAFRTTQGAGYGKAITPYAEARLGEGILVTNNTANAIKGKAKGTLKNYFLDQKGQLDKQAKAALKKARAKQLNQAFIGGQRFQSTSDARYENASDYLIAALEMQAMAGMVQVYTKVDGAVPAFSTWGFSINQSLMPLGGGLDANGNVRDTSTGGMNRDVAFRNRDKFETAGTVTIGVNDNHIRKMFAQWVRDFIIPYHASGGKATMVAEFRDIQEKKAAKGAKVRSTDYSRTQSDKVLSDEVLRWMGKTDADIARIHAVRDARIAILTGKTPDMDVVRGNRFLSNLYDKLRVKGGEWYGVVLAKGKVESQIFPNEFWDQSVSYEDSAKVTEDYLAYCIDLGFLHRFSGMVPQNGVLRPVNGYNEKGERVQLTDLAYKYKDGKKTDEVEPFFWKVLTDRRMYDNSKRYLPQKRVVLNDTTKETVATFATGNYGRQYNAELSAEIAAKLADAKLSARDAEAVEFSDITTKFSVRESDPPKKTIIAYKAFYAHDGKLYPPMVANLAEEEQTKIKGAVSGTLKALETPVGVWVDADVGGIATYSSDFTEYDIALDKAKAEVRKRLKKQGYDMKSKATQALVAEEAAKIAEGTSDNVVHKKGEVIRNTTGRLAVQNAKSGGDATLAFRPGWHLGEWPDAKQFNKDSALGARSVMPDSLVFCKCEIAADVDYQLDAMSYGVNAKGKFDRTQAGLPRVPVDGYYKYRTNVDPTTAPWYITGAMRVVEVLDDADCARICAEFGVTPDPRESGKPIDLAAYGLKRGRVTPTKDLGRFKKNQKNIDNEAMLERALSDPDYANAYVQRDIDFDDPEIVKEFERNRQNAEEYRKKAGKIKLSERDSDGRKLSAEQQEFFKDSKVRDAEGNLMVMYHGTANGGAFTVFDGNKLSNEARTTQLGQGFYFTNVKREAEAYTKNVDIYGRVSQGASPHLHKVYLNIANPFNVDTDALDINAVKAVYMDGAYEYFFDQWIPFYMNKKTVAGKTYTKTDVQAMSKEERVSVYVDYLSQLGTKEVLSNMVRAFPHGKQADLLSSMQTRLGYDGLVEEFKPGQFQYVAFASEQVKDVDNLKPTANPDIRYSDRDTAYLDAVNSGDMETAQKMVDEAAKKAGYNSPKLYHGTRQFGFTQLKTSGVEAGVEWSPFFATDKIPTAETYSRSSKVRKISDTQYFDYDAVIEEEEANWRDAIESFADAASRFVGVRGWMESDYVDSEVGGLFEDVVNGKIDSAEAIDTLWDFTFAVEHDMFCAMYEATVEGMDEADKDEALEKLQEEVQEALYQYTDRLWSAISAAAKAETDSRGNYQLYANTDNLFVIDAKGARWNSIDFEADGYNGFNGQPRKKWKTRHLAEYARDKGYSGVLVRNLIDDGGQGVYKQYVPSDIYIFFNPQEQVKSADPVTYDENGNVIPLSERFNPQNDDIRYSERDKNIPKTFRNSQNAMGEFVANVLVDLADMDGEWWTGRYNHAILGMSKSDDTEFRQFYQEIDRLTRDMDGFENTILETSFTVQNRSGKEFIYRVSLDGYLHGVVLEKIDKAKYESALQRKTKGGSNGKSAANIKRRIRNARTEVGRNSAGNGGNFTPDSSSGYGRLGVGSPHGDSAGNGSRGESAGQKTSGVTYASNREKMSERDTETSNRAILTNAFMELAQNDTERAKIEEYRQKVAYLDEQESKLAEIREELKELSFAKGKRDKAKIRALRDEATKISNRIGIADKQLLRLEASKPLMAVLEREKAKAYAKASQKWQDRIEKARTGRDSAEVRRKIKAFKAKLEKNLLNPTDTQYIPVDLIKAMVDVCNLIDIDTDLYHADGSVNKAQQKRNLTKEKLQDLKEEYEKLKTNSDPIYQGEFDEMVYTYIGELVDKFKGKPLKEMSLDDLTEMYETLRAIDDTLRDARKLIGWGDADSVYEAGDAIAAEQQEITNSRKDGKRSPAQVARDKMLSQSLSPVRNVERMSAYHSDSYLLKLFKKFEQGIRKKNKFVMDAYKSFEHLTSDKAYEDAMYKEVGGKKYTDIRGRKFGLSKMQMMQAILSYERETANHMSHIEKGGFTFADLDMLSKGKLREAISEEHAHRVPFAVDMVAEFAKELENDKWCQDYMAAARKFFNGTAKDAINETSIALKHRIIAKDKSYIPFEVDKNFVTREISAENNIQQTINSYGMLKAIKDKAPQPLIITGLNNILDRHIEQVGNVYGLAVEVRNFNKVWNVKSENATGSNPTVKAAVQGNWGDEGVKSIEQAVKDIQGRRQSDQSDIYRKIKSGYIGATFLLNMSVVTKQIGSLYSATSMLKWRGPVRQLANLVYTMANHKSISAEVDKYTATAWMRRQGLSDAEVHTFMTEGKKTLLGRLTSKLPAALNPGKWISAMDHAVALSLWRYAKQDTAKRTGLTGEALLKATAEFFDEVVENTQSMSDVLHRPELQKRSDIMAEAFAMFKTDLFQMSGQLEVTAGRYKANKTKENGKALVRTVYAIAMSAMWAQLMTTVFALLRYKVNPYRDEEDEELTAESWLKRQGFALAGDLVGYVLPIFGSEVVGFFENIMYGESEEIVDSIALTAINDLYDTMTTVATAIKDGEMPDPSQMKKLVVKSLQVFGIPANNIIRTYEAIHLHAKDIANGEFLSFEAGIDRSTKHHVHRIMEALEEGKTDVAVGLYEEALEETAIGKAKDGVYSKEDLSSARSSLKTALGNKLKSGEITEKQALDALVMVFGYDRDEASADVAYWSFKQQHPDAEVEDSWFDKYYEYAEKANISVEMYMNYRNTVKDITGEGKKERRMAVIHSLPISKNQKDALYYSEGWAASTIHEAPWH